ncbi:hypothetical protein [Rhodoligotrophos defluvii]|uniref:hypothetical protein n=1 Tax=Rhodoligotrophos defluvii TaxID=2561934 RepID=UPI0014859296|nr:hypothetical protein [Rhodoligotrophos defluvii]
MARSGDGEKHVADRSQRLAEALRANLRKRKAQMRIRRDANEEERVPARQPAKDE